jgi:hypothetical protein
MRDNLNLRWTDALLLEDFKNVACLISLPLCGSPQAMIEKRMVCFVNFEQRIMRLTMLHNYDS